MSVLGAKAVTRIRRTIQPRGTSGRRPPPLLEETAIRMNIQPPTDQMMRAASVFERAQGIMFGITEDDIRTADQIDGVLADFIRDTRGRIYEVRGDPDWNAVLVHKECMLVRVQERDLLRDSIEPPIEEEDPP